jgi:biotin transport system permease protein/energy-coupling factor transport system permease protein
MNEAVYGGMDVHRIDPRVKLISMALVSISCASTQTSGLILFSGLLILIMTRIRPGEIFRGYRMLPFFLVLSGLFLARAITVNEIGGDSWINMTVTPDSLWNGVWVCWRLIVVTLAGIILISTTPMFQIKAGLEWFLRPFPLISGQHISTLITLMVRFLPVILEETQKVSDAQQARCIHARKNPVARVMHLAMPVLKRTILTADRLTDAMQSRCYNENRTRYDLHTTRTDWTAFSMVICICLLTILF